MIRMKPILTNIKVSGTFLLPTAIYLLCDFHMKDNVKQKLSEAHFSKDAGRKAMHHIFWEKREC